MPPGGFVTSLRRREAGLDACLRQRQKKGCPGAALDAVQCRGSDHGFLLFLLHLHELFAAHAEPHDQRAGDEDGGVDAEADADGEGEGEVVKSFTAEQQHGEHHDLRAAVGDDGATDSAGGTSRSAWTPRSAPRA